MHKLQEKVSLLEEKKALVAACKNNIAAINLYLKNSQTI